MALIYVRKMVVAAGRVPPWSNWVARWVIDYYHPSSNLGVGIPEGCFIFDFALLPLEVARTI